MCVYTQHYNVINIVCVRFANICHVIFIHFHLIQNWKYPCGPKTAVFEGERERERARVRQSTRHHKYKRSYAARARGREYAQVHSTQNRASANARVRVQFAYESENPVRSGPPPPMRARARGRRRRRRPRSLLGRSGALCDADFACQAEWKILLKMNYFIVSVRASERAGGPERAVHSIFAQTHAHMSGTDTAAAAQQTPNGTAILRYTHSAVLARA